MANKQSTLTKVNILKKATLDSIDLSKHVGEIFATTDEPEISLLANGFAESERQKSKNLFDKNNATIYDAYIDIHNNAFIHASVAKSVVLEIKPNTTYTVSKLASARFAIGTSVLNPNTDVDGIPYIAGVDTTTHLTITSGAHDKYLLIFCYHTTEDTVSLQTILDSLQVEYGAVATDYQPYGGGPITHNGDKPVVFAESERQKSKNLFKIETASTVGGGITYTADANTQTITINGTTTSSYTRIAASGYEVLETGKTYTISGDFTSEQTIATYLHFADGTFETMIIQGKRNKITFTPNQQKVINALAIEMYNKTFDNAVLRIQVEQGNVATDWQYPYGPIVHEKDIADVERYETLYDMDSNDADINLGNKGGLLFIGADTTVATLVKDKNKYSHIRFTIRFYDDSRKLCFTVENATTTQTRCLFTICPDWKGSDWICNGSIFIHPDGRITPYTCKAFYIPDMSYNENYDNNSNFYVSKIEGVSYVYSN